MPLRFAAASLATVGVLSISPAPAVAAPSAQHLVGQKLVVSMDGHTPSASLLDRARRGRIGGVLIHGWNFSSATQLRTIANELQEAAAEGGRPPLLIAVDQEGGQVKTISWIPTTLSPPQMGDLGSSEAALPQGRRTGAALLAVGVNTDFAPVADVPASTSSFMYQQGRTWSFSSTTTTSLADAFASGLEAGGSLPAMKHFPGIGYAAANTDTHVVSIPASKSALAPGLRPYTTAIAHGIPMIMLSNATYPAYDATNAAGWSHAISVGLLRTTLGFRGVTVTDSLTGTAAARGVSPTTLAVKAAKAGTDMILVTGSEASTASTYSTLVADAGNGTIPLATLQASYDRILALKASLKGAVADATPATVGGPQSRLYAPSTLGTTTAPVRTSFSASDPCGVSATSMRRSTAGGTATTQSLSTPTARTLTQSLAF